MSVQKITDCDLYRNPYLTHCRGSISPDGDVSVCWRHLAESRDFWMRRAQELTVQLKKTTDQHSGGSK